MRAALAFFLLGCATVTPLPPIPDEPPPVPPPTAAAPPPPPACNAFARPGVLRRSVVTRAVDGGLGRWLGNLEVDPQRDKGRFRGWIIRRFFDPCFAEVDLKAGDVVQRINGTSVERPEQANEVFLGLRSAPALVVEYTRGGTPQKLSLSIAEE